MCPQNVMGVAKYNCSSNAITSKSLRDFKLIGNDSPDDLTEEVSTLKSKLKLLLLKHRGSTKHPDVLEVIEKLSIYNPASRTTTCPNVFHSSIFCGDFVTATSPNFAGRIESKKEGNCYDDDDTAQYTLGRLSFNIFQPAKLLCTLLTVRNRIIDNNESADPLNQYSTSSSSSSQSESEEEEKKEEEEEKENHGYTYYILCDIIVHTPKGDLPAVLRNEGVCYPTDPSTNRNQRVMVSFSGGTLMPAEETRHDDEKLNVWEETFQDAYTQADEERSFVGSVFLSLLKWVFGLSMPMDDTLLLNHSFHFDMKRAPVGYMDVLYLDKDMRITKGNKGTLVVAERDKAEQ